MRIKPSAFLLFVLFIAFMSPVVASETRLYVKVFDDLPITVTPSGLLVQLGESDVRQGLRELNNLSPGYWLPVHEIPRDHLKELRRTGELRTQQSLPDLSTEFYFEVRGEWSSYEGQISQVLEANPLVESWYVVSTNIVSTTPDFQGNQTSLNSPPNGVGVASLWPGYTGSGVTVGVLENSYYSGHDDIPSAIPTLSGTPTSVWDDQQHGTAAIGIVAARANGWGTTGIAHGATIKYFGSWNGSNNNIPAAVTTATSALSAGDVLLANVQYDIQGVGLVPAEYFYADYNAIKTAVANGIIVVIAAGNGNLNLNNVPRHSSFPWWINPFSRATESGAIYVGAGAPPNHSTTAARARLNFSNYGSRLDVQSHGANVFTPGYGYHYSAEGIKRYFRADFGGTSSATPIVAGTAALLQSMHKSLFSVPATPAQMRTALKETGAPQNMSVAGVIGPSVSAAGAYYYFTTNPPSLSVWDWWCYGQGSANWSSVSTANSYQLLGHLYSGSSQYFYIGSNTSTMLTVSESTDFNVRACVNNLGGGCTKWSNVAGPVHAHSMCH